MGGEAEAFIRRWQGSGGAERANYALFLAELCDVVGVPRPEPAHEDGRGDYRFEYPVTFRHADGSISAGRIDLYKRDCFVLEAKQGTDAQLEEQLPLFGGDAGKAAGKGTMVRGSGRWSMAMQRARAQAEAYARALPAAHGWPPFLIVVDVGHEIQLFADFSRTGRNYSQFPDAQRFRIRLDDLRRPDIQTLLRRVWSEPAALDPSRRSARVTKEIADHLAQLSRLLERRHDPERVAHFLMRCLFTMFAEDVGLLPRESFTNLLRELVAARRPDKFRPQVEQLWGAMNVGGFAHAIDEFVPAFNGGLFADPTALDLAVEEIGILLEAANYDWQEVEPAIFGTLLERALDPRERHRLGAHFTPRAYVERLVMPTVIEPLRKDWVAVQVSALQLAAEDKPQEALAEVKRFHERLCATRVLDPACGTGNFLYVAMELMKRLEGEVIELARELGQDQHVLELDRHTVDPHQFLGIEVNPRAAAIADLVLWLGHLQGHFRTRGQVMPAQPVLRNFKNIECRDAVLAYDRVELIRDAHGKPLTRWDGRTKRKHPVTGKEVPNETAQVPIERYVNPQPAAWPKTDFIVGNPPFIGTKRMRAVQGDGYVDAVRSLSPTVPDSADYVMFWWDRAARLLRSGEIRRFGFVSTNSIGQSFNRQVLKAHLTGETGLSLVFAIPDHPWVDSEGGAAVRIAMTVARQGSREGVLRTVLREQTAPGAQQIAFNDRFGRIDANLHIGADLTSAVVLHANTNISGMGVALHGSGFILDPTSAGHYRRCGTSVIKPYIGGVDLLHVRRERYLIDFSFMSQDEAAAANPAAFQHVIDHVKPERDHNRREVIRRLWWRFGWERPELRQALAGLTRYIATTETAKHRVFQFIDAAILPDHMIVAIALDDAFFLGVLSSRVHVAWALAVGGTLENRPRYNKTRCFDPFPFPDPDEGSKARIRALGEQLDAHRKRRQQEHPGLTMTGMYNVLEKLRRGDECGRIHLTAEEKAIHEQGLVSVLRDLHERLDAAVLAAYGWPADLADEAILARLAALNRERAAEEKQGRRRWLRPDYQAPKAKMAAAVQEEMAVAPVVAAGAAPVWPKALPEQVQALKALLDAAEGPIEPGQAIRRFRGARRERVAGLLHTLVALGQARALPEGRFGR